MPISHDLPSYRRLFPEYSSNVARIAGHVKAKYPDLTFIDIGANVGDTVVILRGAEHFPILCIEGDDWFFAILQINTAKLEDVHLEHTFVGSMTGSVRGSIYRQRGTARLMEDETGGQTLHMETLSAVLEHRPLFAQAKMMKLDTDGFDCRILRSELELLSCLKPVIFFEYDPYFFSQHMDNGSEIFRDLQSVGYKAIMVYENHGDYSLTVELTNRLLLEDIHNFYSGRQGMRYCDICAFHEDDFDLCQTIRLAELEFFRRHRGITYQ